MKRPKKPLEVVLNGELFDNKVAWRVFVAVLERIGIDIVQRTHVMTITAERPEREDFYVRVGDWWVRKHMNVDSMVGILTQLKDRLGLSMQIRVRDLLQEILA
jgi:hypothetical protein